MTFALEFEDGPLAGQMVELHRGSQIVGNAQGGADIVVSHRLVSKRHAEIIVDDDGCRVRDLGSKNGTRMRDQVLSSEFQHMQPGDDLVFARAVRARLLLDPSGHMFEATHRCIRCGRVIALETFADGQVLDHGDGRFTCPRCASGDETETWDQLVGEVGRTLALPGLDVLCKLAEGGMGAVYKARQVDSGRLVVVKVIRTEFAHDSRIVKRFLREAKMVALLSHPHVVKLYDTGRVAGYDFIVMEYVEGQSLKDLICAHGRLAITRALDIGCHLAEALEAARALSIVHRDVKPANVLVAPDGQAKLADFGLAVALESSGVSRMTLPGTAMGTLPYMPPEQLVDAGDVDHRADIYGLGATLYHAITGRVPFPCEGPKAMIGAINAQRPEAVDVLCPGLSRSVDRLLQRALEKRPEDRFETAGKMRQAMKRLLLGLR